MIGLLLVAACGMNLGCLLFRLELVCLFVFALWFFVDLRVSCLVWLFRLLFRLVLDLFGLSLGGCLLWLFS